MFRKISISLLLGAASFSFVQMAYAKVDVAPVGESIVVEPVVPSKVKSDVQPNIVVVSKKAAKKVKNSAAAKTKPATIQKNTSVILQDENVNTANIRQLQAVAPQDKPIVAQAEPNLTGQIVNQPVEPVVVNDPIPAMEGALNSEVASVVAQPQTIDAPNEIMPTIEQSNQAIDETPVTEQVAVQQTEHAWQSVFPDALPAAVNATDFYVNSAILQVNMFVNQLKKTETTKPLTLSGKVLAKLSSEQLDALAQFIKEKLNAPEKVVFYKNVTGNFELKQVDLTIDTPFALPELMNIIINTSGDKISNKYNKRKSVIAIINLNNKMQPITMDVALKTAKVYVDHYGQVFAELRKLIGANLLPGQEIFNSQIAEGEATQMQLSNDYEQWKKTVDTPLKGQNVKVSFNAFKAAYVEMQKFAKEKLAKTELSVGVLRDFADKQPVSIRGKALLPDQPMPKLSAVGPAVDAQDQAVEVRAKIAKIDVEIIKAQESAQILSQIEAELAQQMHKEAELKANKEAALKAIASLDLKNLVTESHEKAIENDFDKSIADISNQIAVLIKRKEMMVVDQDNLSQLMAEKSALEQKLQTFGLSNDVYVENSDQLYQMPFADESSIDLPMKAHVSKAERLDAWQKSAKTAEVTRKLAEQRRKRVKPYVAPTTTLSTQEQALLASSAATAG